jgi:hypothetical protein
MTFRLLQWFQNRKERKNILIDMNNLLKNQSISLGFSDIDFSSCSFGRLLHLTLIPSNSACFSREEGRGGKRRHDPIDL